MKKQEALNIINDIFGDTNVSPEQTLDELREIKEDVEMKILCLESDLQP